MKLFGFLLQSQLLNAQNSADEFDLSLDPFSPTYVKDVLSFLDLFGPAVREDEELAKVLPNFQKQKTTRGNELDSDPTRGLRQLKLMVVAMMDPAISLGSTGTGFGRYCYYGCHCLPDADHSEFKVFGKPVDNIDRTCRDFGTCYHCLKLKHPKCIPERTAYRFRLKKNKRLGTRSIDCQRNKEGSCERDTCECDKFFAETVALHEREWNQSYHIFRGGFDRDVGCRAAPAPAIQAGSFQHQEVATVLEEGGEPIKVQFNGGNGGLGGLPEPIFNQVRPRPLPSGAILAELVDDSEPATCCGMETFPYVSIKKPGQACCRSESYNPFLKKCCMGKLYDSNEVC
ncbi:Oidioi.mRNA.OKI2018_I69.XSR.g16542.t1.cds [Oikopleura dioica]|uniref:Oidioi.mRNA.OKI2018_I69.XSR.g16542.t1.cds n=1 Tax=Oikopleura dioica TaxID=34765 RepID=A0ABN7SGF6_OIKDI|nr:Oidioi.mRNA.OKI2018_I69.XSR.g16542.t1.cds [Oikopleura dioica]